VPYVTGPLVALSLQPDEDSAPPVSSFSDGDIAVVAAFAILVAVVFGFDMVRTWWDTNEWRRDARRRRRELR
jgi:hypothetical protein